MPSYGAHIPGGGRNSEDYAGWGWGFDRPCGWRRAVRARADRPDQPDPERSDPTFYAPEYPGGGYRKSPRDLTMPNPEFSMIAHFQEVRAGEGR